MRIWYVRIFFGETVNLIVLSTWIFLTVSTVSFAGGRGGIILTAFKHYRNKSTSVPGSGSVAGPLQVQERCSVVAANLAGALHLVFISRQNCNGIKCPLFVYVFFPQHIVVGLLF